VLQRLLPGLRTTEQNPEQGAFRNGRMGCWLRACLCGEGSLLRDVNTKTDVVFSTKCLELETTKERGVQVLADEPCGLSKHSEIQRYVGRALLIFLSVCFLQIIGHDAPKHTGQPSDRENLHRSINTYYQAPHPVFTPPSSSRQTATHATNIGVLQAPSRNSCHEAAIVHVACHQDVA